MHTYLSLYHFISLDVRVRVRQRSDASDGRNGSDFRAPDGRNGSDANVRAVIVGQRVQNGGAAADR